MKTNWIRALLFAWRKKMVAIQGLLKRAKMIIIRIV